MIPRPFCYYLITEVILFLEEYKATVSVGSGVFYDRFDGDECLEDALDRAGKYIKALKDWKNDLSGENGNSSTNG